MNSLEDTQKAFDTRQAEWEARERVRDAERRRSLRVYSENFHRSLVRAFALGAAGTAFLILVSALAKGASPALIAPLSVALVAALGALAWPYWIERRDPLWSARYDAMADAAYFRVAPKSVEIAETREVAPGAMIDLDATGDVVGFEVIRLRARRLPP